MPTPDAPTATWALLLMKDPARSKTRLAGVLTGEQRQTLAKKMFRHVLDQLRQTDSIAAVTVMSPGRPPLPRDVHWLRDSSPELNASVAEAIATLSARGASQVLVLPADLPLVSREELEDLIGADPEYDMVIAPDRDESGTNALLLKAPTRFRPGFGEDSFRRHLAQAEALELKTKIVKCRGLAFDLDDEDDWKTFRDLKPALPCETI